MTDTSRPRRVAIIMVDIETLGKAPDAVVTQMAFKAVDKDDPSEDVNSDAFYLPLTPQTDLNRKIDPETVIWWLDQDERARSRFKENSGGDFNVLVAFVRSFIAKVQAIIESSDDYEIWARGPQFDIVILESLFASCGESAPWDFRKVFDLRTMMELAGVKKEDVDSHDIVPHVALEDCRFQLRCWQKARDVIGTVVSESV